MRLTPRILDVLAESLEVYFRIFRRSAGQLLTVLVPMELVYALAVSWYCGGRSASAGPFGFLKTVMWLTAGLAVVSAGGERHEREKRNPVQTVSWEEIKSLRAASAPDDADDNEFVTVLSDFDAATITGEVER